VTHTLKKTAGNVLSVRSVLRALDRHVQMAECTVRGHMTIYQDLLVLVESTVKRPTRLQLEACLRETEKLSLLIESSSPRIMIDLSLSTLISAIPVHELITNGGSPVAAAAFLVAASLAALFVH